MTWTTLYLVIAMFLFPAGPEPENPWQEKVAAAVQKAERGRTIAAYREALDITYRADDWRAALKLAHAAYKEYPNNQTLLGRIARAMWRGGRIDEAERIIDTIPDHSNERVAITIMIELNLARGEYKKAAAAAKRLEILGPKTALEHYHLLSMRLVDDRMEGLPELLKNAAELVNPDNGYPEIFLEEALDGLPEFFAAIGPKPINIINSHGSADMPMNTAIRLPYCTAMINGQGPYRLIVDTGGSITLSLDDDIAGEIGLKSHGTASIRGISGKQDSEQTLVEELKIGGITCQRVMTRTFAFPDLITLAADGIIGTGVFNHARMQLDFENAQLIVSPSSTEPAPGQRVDVRIVGDAKLMAPIKLQGQYAVALLDSGADVAAVSPIALKELFPDYNLQSIAAAGMGVGEGAAAGIALAPGVKLEFWGRTFDNYSGIGLDALDTLLSPILGIQTQVLLGMPVFREMNKWTIDYPTRKMWVEWIE